jgi:FKBP-type peptidyl-prolyl cis-trans isomerase
VRPVVTRRAKAVAAGLAASVVLLSGCGSSKSTAKPAGTPTSTAPSTAPVAKVASDEFGQRAKIDIPAGQPTGNLETKVKIAGKGAKIADNDYLVLNFTGKLWRDNLDLGSSYDTGQGPITQQLGAHKMLAGWEQGLKGQTAGSRVEIVVPPNLGFGANGQDLGPVKVGATDTMVFDIDVVAVYHTADADIPAGPSVLNDPGLPAVSNVVGKGDPKVTMPAGKTPPTTGVYKTVIQGKGPAVKSGQSIVVQYEGMIWRDGSLFDSSWSRGKLMFATNIGVGRVVKGWDEGLVGQNVGSRVLLVVPPDLGYGAAGQPQAGIKGDDTMVFVVDILDAG